MLKKLKLIGVASFYLLILGIASFGETPPIRIMPLGDSITYGSSTPAAPGGYRLPLYIALTNAGYNVDYVGTVSGNSAPGLGAEIHHEGHGGWRITNPVNGLYDFIYGWFEAIEEPHVILLHIGTNDSSGFNAATNDVNNLDRLITRLAECQPSAQIIVTSLLKRGEPNYTYITNYFNPYVPGKVAGQQALGRQVTFLDMHAYLELSDMNDNLHPNESGYAKMADAWFPAITNVIGTNVVANLPAPIRAIASASSLINVDVTFNKALSAATATNLANYIFSGGITATNAVLSANQRKVSLLTTLQSSATTYTVTMNNIEDESAPTPLSIPSGSQVVFTTLSGPAALSAVADDNHVNVTVAFSKKVAASSAENISNYAIDGGVTVTGASLSSDQLSVTLTTSLLAVGTTYTLTLNNIRDETAPSGIAIPADTQLTFIVLTPRGYLNNVAESSGYQLVYALDLPNTADYINYYVPYAVDNSAAIDDGRFSRVAYYMELQKTGEDLQYLWVSMDAFTPEADKIGIPTRASGASYQQFVQNLNVFCNVSGVTTGTALSGNLEFWADNYTAANGAGVPGASSATYDFGDTRSAGNYCSMQVHNYLAGETLMAINHWGSGGTLCIGIGNQPSGSPDWTFKENAAEYTVKTLQVLVLYDNSSDTTAPEVVSAQIAAGVCSVAVTFNESVSISSITPSRFAIDNGVQVSSAELQPDGKTVWLTTTALPDVALTLTINGVRDTAANLIAANTTVSLMPLVPAGIISNVGTNAGELAAGYQLIYSIDLPVYSRFADMIEHYYFNRSAQYLDFDRVAYYLELTPANGGATQYIWTSMDAFTDDLTSLGVPTAASGNIFQQTVANLDVKSNVGSVTNGTGMAGNIEFWPTDYTAANAIGIPGASGTAYDFGDQRSTTGTHGSMQVHNTTYGQCLMNMSNFGANGSRLSLGIGNRPGSSNIDWTHAANANAYVHRRMHILARPVNTPPPLPPEVAANVPGASGYKLVYTIALPASGANFYDNAASYYTVNNYTNDMPATYSRIAYYLELQSGTAPTQYIWTAMDAFTSNGARIGVPVGGTYFRQYVSNLEVQSNVGGIITGTGITTGNIEFWPSNYGGANSFNIPNADGDYDFGDSGGGTGKGYGSMQVHNYGAAQTLFAFNNFNNNQVPCLGIGNRPGQANTDWTFAVNAGSYNHRRLHVLVLPGGDGDNTGPTLSSATASRSLNQVAARFSEALADTAADPSKYTLNNGGSVLAASLQSDQRFVVLQTSPLTAGQNYTLSVTGVRDRSVNGNMVQPFSSANFNAPAITARPAFLTNVMESAGYELIHELAVANNVSYANGCNYTVDESPFTRLFDRIAYCMELEGTNGVYQWVYVSMDAYTTNLRKIGVPTADRGAAWQLYVNNMNVYASGNAAVTTGEGITTGNLEFWPSNYSNGNTAGIPGASSSLYDFGDSGFNTTAGHGSMQVHNYGASQTILSMISFGSNGRTPGLGIGNNPRWSNNDPDWTFTYNAATYATKKIYVLVRDGTAGVPLRIWTQPVSMVVDQSAQARFNVYSPDALSYQWRKNGVVIPGATASWLEFSSADITDSGSYDAIAISATGSTVSESATLLVVPQGTVILVR